MNPIAVARLEKLEKELLDYPFKPNILKLETLIQEFPDFIDYDPEIKGKKTFRERLYWRVRDTVAKDLEQEKPYNVKTSDLIIAHIICAYDTQKVKNAWFYNEWAIWHYDKWGCVCSGSGKPLWRVLEQYS